jgi:arabinose-5-phosphate isomerase
VPVVAESALISQALLEMTEKKLGMTAIVGTDNRVTGIFTDGDLRRMLGRNLDVHKTPIIEVMTPIVR